jgi:DNA-directed RNA polymerase subunit RPC12/RpoP
MMLKEEVVYNCACGKCIVVPGVRQEHLLLVCPYCMARLNPPAPPVIPSKEFP